MSKCNFTHPIYNSWKSIKTRCYNSNNINYLGGNIIVCEEWMNFNNFYDWAINHWKPGLVLVRKDKALNYNPDNCEFVDKKIVSSNNGKMAGLKRKGKPRSKETNDKIKKTNLLKYGVEHVLQNKEIQNKCKKSLLNKYGVDNSGQIPEGKIKSKLTSLNKYGFDHHSKSPESKLKSKLRTIKNGQANYFEGKTSDELAKEIGISRSCMNLRIRKYGFEKAVSMDKRQSEIEFIIEQLLIKNKIEYIKGKKVSKFFPDFVLPENNIIIETDGLYWHSDAINDSKNYHRDKQIEYNKYGFKSLFFREHEIHNKLSIIESIILNKLNKTTKVYARKCKLIEVNKKDCKEFLNQNHLMGYGKGRSFALVIDNQIKCLMQIVNKAAHLEVSRFCNESGFTVVGGFSRLLKHVTNTFLSSKIITFIDKRYGSGDYLSQFGFVKENEDLSFVWIKNNNVKHRLIFKGNSGYDNGYFKLWDCGQAKFVKDLTPQLH